MNVVAKSKRRGQSESLEDNHAETGAELEQFVKAARRQIWVVLAFCAVGFALGAAYIAQSVARYTASAVIIIDSARDKSSISASIADLTYDSGAIDSQLEVLKSEGTASSVLDRIDLVHNPEFIQPRESGIARWVRSVRHFGGIVTNEPLVGDYDTAEEGTRRVMRQSFIDQLQGGLDVRRVGRSYVINIEYTATSPELAAKIANGFAHAYVSDQLDAKTNAMKQTGEYLEKRAGEFKQRWLSSDRALQEYKANHNLITADGKFLGDQQMLQISTQYTNAQNETAQALARYTQIDDLLKGGKIDAVVTESLASPVINDLRLKFLRTAELEKQVSSTLGPGQSQAVALRQAMADYNQQILSELKRIADAYKSDYEVAGAKEATLRMSMADLAKANTNTEKNLVPWRMLEGEVASNRQVYETLIRRQQDIEERQRFPEAEARIITDAAPPPVPAYPKRSVIMALSLILGGFSGIGMAALRESRDRTFRTAYDVRHGLNLTFHGMLPAVRVVKRTASPDENPAHLHARYSSLTHSIDHPFSDYNEVLQSVKLAADLVVGRKGGKVIGIVSVRPNEGKTTVSKNFASLMAQLGFKTILLDGDLHQRGLTMTAADQAKSGLLEVLAGQNTVDEAIITEVETGLHVLPVVVKDRMPHSSHVLSSAPMRELIDKLRTSYDYVVADLPPIGPVIGVRAIGAYLDGVLIVVEWGRTAQALVRDVLLVDNEISTKCLGVVYNKVNLQKLKYYESIGSPVHQKDFGSYFRA